MSSGSAEEGSPFVFEHGRVRLALDPSIYGPSAIQKAGYKLAKRFTLLIESSLPHQVQVSLLLHDEADGTVARAVLREFLRELGDQQLREQVREETKGIRELILAHAFSNTDLVNRE